MSNIDLDCGTSLGMSGVKQERAVYFAPLACYHSRHTHIRTHTCEPLYVCQEPGRDVGCSTSSSLPEDTKLSLTMAHADCTPCELSGAFPHSSLVACFRVASIEVAVQALKTLILCCFKSCYGVKY